MTSGTADDERWLVVKGRRWRRTDPAIAGDTAARLTSHLGRARSAVRVAGTNDDADAIALARARVQLAKVGLGERGTKWWETPEEERIARAHDALEELDRLAPPAE